MKKSLLFAGATICLAAGVLTLVTAASLSRRQAEVVRSESFAVPPAAVTQPATASGEVPSASAGEWMTAYTLIERSGKEFNSDQLEGQVHVVNFFFSTCPSICRMQSAKVRELAEEFGPQGVTFLSITCDPQNDTPQNLQNYARLFNADPEDWLFLTSDDLNYLRRVGGEVYQVAVDKQVHSERLIVVDGNGERRGAFHWNEPSETVAMRKLLKDLLEEEG